MSNHLKKAGTPKAEACIKNKQIMSVKQRVLKRELGKQQSYTRKMPYKLSRT